MKIALLFLLCLISATWQQNMFWSFPPRRIPFYSMFNHNLHENSPVLAASDPGLPFHYPNGEIEQRNQERSPLNNFYQRLKPESRAFGLNYLASIILSSLTLSSTSTSYTTTTSTITAATVLTCFTKTMFTSTTACRRKRDAVPNLLIGDSEDEHLNAPGVEIVATNPLELPGEGRDVDPSQLIVSSRNEEFGRSEEFAPADLSFDRYFRNYRNVIVSFAVTLTLTSYTVYYSPSTRTVTNLAATTALSCLPSGFTLC